jgi:hypothetical protein
MQAETANIKSKRGGSRAGSGRRPGYKAPSTVAKIATKYLEQVLQDESAPPEARTLAATTLINVAAKA